MFQRPQQGITPKQRALPAPLFPTKSVPCHQLKMQHSEVSSPRLRPRTKKHVGQPMADSQSLLGVTRLHLAAHVDYVGWCFVIAGTGKKLVSSEVQMQIREQHKSRAKNSLTQQVPVVPHSATCGSAYVHRYTTPITMLLYWVSSLCAVPTLCIMVLCLVRYALSLLACMSTNELPLRNQPPK